jgi:chromosomal replication initiator protein
MKVEEKPILNPYVFPGLKVNEKEKRKILSSTIHKHYKISKEDVLEIIAEEVGVPMTQIIKRSRRRELVNARFIYCAILKDHFGYTLERIGDEIDGRDHTSIRHAIIEYRNRLYQEETFKNIVNNIYNRIGIKTK